MAGDPERGRATFFCRARLCLDLGEGRAAIDGNAQIGHGTRPIGILEATPAAPAGRPPVTSGGSGNACSIGPGCLKACRRQRRRRNGRQRLDRAVGTQPLDGGKGRGGRRLGPDAFLCSERHDPAPEIFVFDRDGMTFRAAQRRPAPARSPARHRSRSRSRAHCARPPAAPHRRSPCPVSASPRPRPPRSAARDRSSPAPSGPRSPSTSRRAHRRSTPAARTSRAAASRRLRPLRRRSSCSLPCHTDCCRPPAQRTATSDTNRTPATPNDCRRQRSALSFTFTTMAP